MPRLTHTLLIVSGILILLSSGCVTKNPRHNNVNRLINNHAQGFEDATLASPQAEGFVRDALETIANLEGELIRRE